MQEKNMGHICPIGRSGVNETTYSLQNLTSDLLVIILQLQHSCNTTFCIISHYTIYDQLRIRVEQSTGSYAAFSRL